MQLYLLTHERELNKISNTGCLVKECLGDQVEVIIWKRKEPCLKLVELINKGEVAMLYPDKLRADTLSLESDSDEKFSIDESVNDEASAQDFEKFLILDSTWQEARKMYNRSVYLQQAKKISLQAADPSTYRKRRNQIEGGLSTAECAIELLKLKGLQAQATDLQVRFNTFNLS